MLVHGSAQLAVNLPFRKRLVELATAANLSWRWLAALGLLRLQQACEQRVQKLIVNEGYVIGLLADLEQSAPRLLEEFNLANKRASVIDAELGQLLLRYDSSNANIKEARQTVVKAGLQINDDNLQIANLHQEIASLRRRSEDVKTEMERVGPGAIARKLRRERAKLQVQVEDREEEIEDLRTSVEKLRQQLQDAEETVGNERDRNRAVTLELDKLQGQLPSPYLYTKLFETLSARAHCRLFLDETLDAWRGEVKIAIGYTLKLHRELRAGKYRLDKNSELVGGRAMATAEAMFGAVALRDNKVALEIFDSATDPGLFFHQIFNVFRVWCLGLYLKGRHVELSELLRHHQFSEGLRGGYVNAFIGILKKNPKQVAVGIKDMAKHEWELWQDPNMVRGAGVVNLGAVALSCLALDAGIAISVPGPTVPDSLIA